MEYVVDVKDRVRGKISNRCRLQIITEVYYSLDAKHKEQFRESCFGHLMDVAEIKMSLQMVHQIILRAVRTTKEKEVWFRFGNRLARFGLEEFVLVSGLKAGELEYEDDSLGLKSDLMQRTFKKSKGKVNRKQLLSAFQRCTHQPDVGRKFFDDLRDQSGWLNGDHVDSALFHIRERAVKYADLFRHDCAVLDSNFWQFVESAYKNMEKSGQNKSEFKFAKVLVNYAEGATPSLGKPWLNCRYLYIPYCVPQVHWFALEVDLEERRINIFDSLTSRVREANLVKFMKPLKVVLPWLLKKHVDGNYNTSMFTHHRVKKLHVQENGSDCGVFTVKFIEFSVAGLDLNLVQPKHMLMWRQKMAAEIFGGEFDP